MKTSILFFLFNINFCLSAVRNTYEGWKVYRIWPHTEQLVEDLGLFYENSLNIDYWTTIREAGQPVDIAVAEIAHPSVENIFFMLNITERTEIEHLHKALNKERLEMRNVPVLEEGQINFATYHRYDTVASYLNNLSKAFGNLVNVEKIGTTFEGRDIKVVKISTGSEVEKPAIFIDAGLSAREWIGPAQALYIINFLLDDANRKLIENVDWFIIPIVNPDGYEYTHTVQRLWKKNRSKGSGKEYGVYINRNFDVKWGEKLSRGDPEHWNYHGPKPFSEAESLAVKNVIEQNSRRIQLYLSLHSFGPTILYPYGFSSDKPENIKLHKWLADKASKAITENGDQNVYRTRCSSGKRFFFSGSSVDWAVGRIGIPLGYTIELPSPGYLGFDFPIAKLEGVLKEFIPGLVVFHDFVRDSFYNPEKIDQVEISAVVIHDEKEEESDRVEEENDVTNLHNDASDGSYGEDLEEMQAENEGNFRSSIQRGENDEL